MQQQHKQQQHENVGAHGEHMEFHLYDGVYTAVLVAACCMHTRQYPATWQQHAALCCLIAKCGMNAQMCCTSHYGVLLGLGRVLGDSVG
jgi:hypothetical protein